VPVPRPLPSYRKKEAPQLPCGSGGHAVALAQSRRACRSPASWRHYGRQRAKGPPSPIMTGGLRAPGPLDWHRKGAITTVFLPPSSSPSPRRPPWTEHGRRRCFLGPVSCSLAFADTPNSKGPGLILKREKGALIRRRSVRCERRKAQESRAFLGFHSSQVAAGS
jgi:hypothetical protein